MANCDECECSDLDLFWCSCEEGERFAGDLTAWRDEIHGELRDLLPEIIEAYPGLDEIRIQIVGYEKEDKTCGDILDEVVL